MLGHQRWLGGQRAAGVCAGGRARRARRASCAFARASPGMHWLRICVSGARSAIRDADGAALAPPWPAIAIGCGRHAALVTRALRRWSAGRSFTVQILDPRIGTDAFDVVVAPQHDDIAGANVIRSIGALNPVDARWLAEGRARFPHFARSTHAAHDRADRRNEPRATSRCTPTSMRCWSGFAHGTRATAEVISSASRGARHPMYRSIAPRIRRVSRHVLGGRAKTARIRTRAFSRGPIASSSHRIR